jgi:hypothetical protein
VEEIRFWAESVKNALENIADKHTAKNGGFETFEI